MGKHDLAPIKTIPILEVAKRLGIEVKGKKSLCFGGHDKNSMSLTFDPNKNLWHCFGCGKGGDSIELVQEVYEVGFVEALGWLAEVFGVDVRFPKNKRNRKRPISAPKPLNVQRADQASKPSEFESDPELYEWLMNRCAGVTEDIGAEYLFSHGISGEIAEKLRVKELRDPERAFNGLIKQWGSDRVYQSGIAWGNYGKPERLIWTSYSLLFPFFDCSNVVYLQGRMFQGNRKFINLRGLEKPLYNVDSLKQLKPGTAVHICEGIPDVLALCSKGLTAVAVLGASSFRPEWVDLFMKHEIVLLPDGDQGGETLRRIVELKFKERGKSIRVLKLPPGQDVADVIAIMGKKI